MSDMIGDKVKFFKALGNESRLRIVSYLLDHDCCACEFESVVDKDQSTISRHLTMLVEAGILEKERQGKSVEYRIRDEDLKETFRTLGIDQIAPCC
ncbi:MAG: ArsR/SmtB family transcription factor [Thermoproteota archaeon]